MKKQISDADLHLEYISLSRLNNVLPLLKKVINVMEKQLILTS